MSHAILVTLLDKPQTGYELAKRFDQTVGFFWRAAHQQIYAELHKMAARDLVAATTVEQADRPNRIVYEISPAGRSEIQDWVKQLTPKPSVKEELLVKLFSLGEVRTDVIRECIRQRQTEHQETLARYREVMREHYPNPARLPARRKGRYLGLRMGILSEESGLKWCAEALGLLK